MEKIVNAYNSYQKAGPTNLSGEIKKNKEANLA